MTSRKRQNRSAKKPIENDCNLLTLADAARVAGVTQSTVKQWMQTGQLKTVRMPCSSRRRVMRGTLNAFLADRQTASKEREPLPFAEVARVANVTRQTVREWVENGHLKTVNVPGYQLKRVRRGTLNAFLAQLQQEIGIDKSAIG